jgi:hypothetical protein
MNKEQKEQIHKEFDEERAIWEKARDEFDGEIASLMDKSEYSNYIGSYHRQALKRFVGELALKYYKQGKGKASEIIDRHLYNLRFKKFDGRLDYELGLEKESNMLRQFVENKMIDKARWRESIKKDLVDEIEKYVFNLYDSIHKETGAYKYDWVVEAMEKAILQIINEKMK